MQNRKVRREIRKKDEPGRRDGLLANPDFARQVMDAATTNGLEEKYHFRALMLAQYFGICNILLYTICSLLTFFLDDPVEV